jgi:hypothetical protein
MRTITFSQIKNLSTEILIFHNNQILSLFELLFKHICRYLSYILFVNTQTTLASWVCRLMSLDNLK